MVLGHCRRAGRRCEISLILRNVTITIVPEPDSQQLGDLLLIDRWLREEEKRWGSGYSSE